MKKKTFFVICILTVTLMLHAQDGNWKIKINNKTVLSTSKEDTANKIKIKRTEWQKSGYFEIIFTDNVQNTWSRSFLFYDSKDKELLRKDSTNDYKIPLKALRKLFAGEKEIKIYTIIAPLNPKIAIRIRRVHLCTLKLTK